jgi:diguanylate cyclase (GGDEF)-like protein
MARHYWHLISLLLLSGLTVGTAAGVMAEWEKTSKSLNGRILKRILLWVFVLLYLGLVGVCLEHPFPILILYIPVFLISLLYFSFRGGQGRANAVAAPKGLMDIMKINLIWLFMFSCSVFIWVCLRHPLLVAFGLIFCVGLFYFVLQSICKRILLRQSGRTYFQSIANANRLAFPFLRKSLEEFGTPVDYSRLRMMHKCDFLVLTHLLKNLSVNRRYSNEERLLRVYFHLQFLSLALRHSLRLEEKKTILRMTLILQHFANLVGPRSSATHGFDIDSVELRLKSGEEFVSDDLTGLKSRRMFDGCLAQEINRSIWYGTRFALLLLDVRKFKIVNDTYGHATGDAILRSVARASDETIRGSDICCRIGGDEFAIILPQSERSNAEALAEGIARKFQAYAKPLAPDTPVGIDYGIAVFPDDGEDATSLLEFANKELCGRKAVEPHRRE